MLRPSPALKKLTGAPGNPGVSTSCRSKGHPLCTDKARAVMGPWPSEDTEGDHLSGVGARG